MKVLFCVRTNLPKEVMGYPDYLIPERPESYLTRTEILDFLNAYCDHFALRPYIRVGIHIKLQYKCVLQYAKSHTHTHYLYHYIIC